MDKTYALDVAIEAVQDKLREAKDNLARVVANNRRVNVAGTQSIGVENYWTKAVQTYERAIAVLEELRHDG